MNQTSHRNDAKRSTSTQSSSFLHLQSKDTHYDPPQTDEPASLRSLHIRRRHAGVIAVAQTLLAHSESVLWLQFSVCAWTETRYAPPNRLCPAPFSLGHSQSLFVLLFQNTQNQMLLLLPLLSVINSELIALRFSFTDRKNKEIKTKTPNRV